MKIAFVGDVMLGRLVNKQLKSVSPAYPWGSTLSILKECDLRVCNLECVLSDVGNPWSLTQKAFHFRSDEKNIHVLESAKIDVASIANNHVLDYEYEALDHMIRIFDAHGILHVGAGKNFSEASKPVICKVENQKIAFFAFTDNEPEWAAQNDKPGIFHLPTKINDADVQSFFKLIEKIRPEVDLLIVSAHWGGNWGYKPPKEHKAIAHALIDRGTDLVFGHSSHVFRGIEIYKNRPIIYSAGDFVDDYAVNEIERNDESFIFVLEKDLSSNFKLYLFPTYIAQFQAHLAPEERASKILSKMELLCKDLGSNLKCFSGHALLDL